MTIAGAKSILIRLSLFVALIKLGYAQDFTNNANIGDFSTPGCGEDQFQCRDQQCIESQLLCDGTADCLDSSDETEYQCSRPELSCPTYTFRCTYGACIDRELRCDGKTDCSADNSDEDGCNSGHGGIGGSYPAYPSSGSGHPVSGSDRPASEPVPVGGCRAPPLPINGMYQIRGTIDNFENVDPDDYFGQELKLDSHLVYSCNPGYKIRGNVDVHCSRGGRWSRKPVCIEIRCRPLSSTSTIANCIHAGGLEEPCSNIIPVPPNTRAQVSCHPGYTKEFVFPQSENVECYEDGKWVPEPVGCKPVCGEADFGQKSFTADGTMTNIRNFPWRASIYVQGNSTHRNEKAFRCGATVIQSNLLLTAARCLYEFTTSSDETFNHDTKPSEFLERLFVITGNIHHDYDSPLHDPQFIRKHRVKNVHTDCSFLVRLPDKYSDDIALIELEEPLQFTSNLLPACLDMTGSIQQSLVADANGNLPNSEEASVVPFSQLLKTPPVVSMVNSPCKVLYNATRSPFYIKDNRFCDDVNNNGTFSPYVCLDDDIIMIMKTTKGMDLCADVPFNDGGGLFYEVDNRWYVMGFVSRDRSVYTDASRTSCNRNSHLLYTKLSKYTRWIQQVASDLERFKYPPCSRYLAPFHKETPTIGSKIKTTTTTESTNVHILPAATGSSCFAPPHPPNGERKLHRDFCGSNIDCDIPVAVALGRGSQLVYSCRPGYKISENTDVYCGAEGKWSSLPFCDEVKCSPLNTVSTIATCTRFGNLVNCYRPVSPNTQAKVSCRRGYWAEVQNDIVKCNNDGIWEPEPSICEPACGITYAVRSRPIVEVKITADTYDFPWRASVYIDRHLATGNRKDFLCGATLIETNLLLTAAHCVFNPRTGKLTDPKKLFILVGNIHRQYDSPSHDFHSVRRGTVKNVYINCELYNVPRNDAGSDIALLELQEPLPSFNLQLPFACLDFSGHKEASLGFGSFGLVYGFGRTVTGVPSYILQTINLRYDFQAECGSAETKPFISSDKFCADYDNEAAACVADGGSGLYTEIDGLWYIVGIASVDPYDNANGNNTCSGDTHILYTRISYHMKWILDVLFHLERYKSYPPCEFQI